MMTKLMKRSVLIATLVLTSVLTVSTAAFAQGRGPAADEGILTDLPELTAEEIEGLIFMAEEEKLARDVYLTLSEYLSEAEIASLRVLDNIARSEQKHIDAVLRLADAYNLDIPADAGTGQFTNEELQALYDELVILGQQSLADALQVGAAIEEIDILDLQEYLAETDNTAIERVYTNLLSGSENHLRAFVSTLERETNEVYQAQYLDQSTFDEILEGSSGRGSSNVGWQSGGGRGRGSSRAASGSFSQSRSGSGRW